MPPEASGSDDPYRVTSATQISYLLSRLRTTHTLLTVQLPGRADTYASVVLQLDPGRRGTVSIDALYPPAGHRLVGPGTMLRLSARIDGAQTAWTARVERVEEGPRGAVYRLNWPDAVQHRQRRAAFRIAIPPGAAGATALVGDVSHGLRAQVVDLSTLGLGALLGNAGELSIGEMLPCVLTLPDSHMLTEIEIKALRQTLGRTRLGGRFLRLSSAQRQTLGRAVAELQRRWIQRSTERAA